MLKIVIVIYYISKKIDILYTKWLISKTDQEVNSKLA